MRKSKNKELENYDDSFLSNMTNIIPNLSFALGRRLIKIRKPVNSVANQLEGILSELLYE